MDDGPHVVPGDDAPHEILVAAIAFDEHGGSRHGRAETRRQVVDDHHAIAGVEQRQHHVAADVSGAACDEYGHEGHLARNWFIKSAALRGVQDGKQRVDAVRVGRS